ncbi:MAG TPA: hypothetical protein ENK37_04990 [Oceanithermus profundus]|uniref:Uncharacterized protein n=1 Tax=Oceanithermus profundus TaxID=187137 RepID=A0A7C4Z8R5_9DEIN|nr:hypothetical protein [Oceanithermus profundus]
MDKSAKREPFPGAYYVGLIITLALLLLMIVIASALPPGPAGAFFAFVLGLTVNPKYAPAFATAGLIAAVLGFAGREPMVAWGGVALVLAQALVYLWHRRGS